MDHLEQGPSVIKVYLRSYLYAIMQEEADKTFDKKLDHLEQFILIQENYNEEQSNVIRRKLSTLKSDFRKRWVSANRTEASFLKNNEQWLNGTFEVPHSPGEMNRSRPGRPEKPFSELSERSKRRKTKELREITEPEQLAFATQKMLVHSGDKEGSTLLKGILNSPNRAKKYKKAYESFEKNVQKLSPLQALSLLVEANLTKRQYDIVRNSNKKFYPSYKILQEVKKECYPVPDSFSITETSAEIDLQALLDHTTSRLVLYLDEVIQRLTDSQCRNMELILKWGCDGSQQTQYKQRFESITDSDANIFQCSLVPLQLVCCTDAREEIWQNPTPSSTRYCRPIFIKFMKESAEITRQEVHRIQTKINLLKETNIEGSREMSIKHTMLLTMVDAKVCNAVTNTTSTMRCYICGATSKEFNNLYNFKEANERALDFGISILHSRIRLFENLLHISYKLPVKKWQLRTEEDKSVYQQRKATIQDNFRQRLGIIVDVPKPGFGNSNDGNTSRRFFADPDLSATITGLDVNLIYRFKVILEALSSGFKINLEKFDTYAMDTAKLYVDLYSWYPMTPTMHKVLIHGPTIIQKALLPIGQLSEEAAEARNKHLRSYRLGYARKFSRIACTTDVINRLLLTSDPLLTNTRTNSRKKSKPFLRDTQQLFLPSNDEKIRGEVIFEEGNSQSDESISEEETSDSSLEDNFDFFT